MLRSRIGSIKRIWRIFKKTFLIQFEWGRAQLDSKNSFRILGNIIEIWV